MIKVGIVGFVITSIIIKKDHFEKCYTYTSGREIWQKEAQGVIQGRQLKFENDIGESVFRISEDSNTITQQLTASWGKRECVFRREK
jgi:hypothetical protein